MPQNFLSGGFDPGGLTPLGGGDPFSSMFLSGGFDPGGLTSFGGGDPFSSLPSFFDFSGGDISSQMMFTDLQNPGGPPLTLAQVRAIDPSFSMPAGEMGGGALTAGKMPVGTIGGATGALQTPFGSLNLKNPDGSVNAGGVLTARMLGLLPTQPQPWGLPQWLGAAAGLGGAGVGLAGIIQSLSGGRQRTTSKTQTSLPPPSPQQTMSQNAALQQLLGGSPGGAAGGGTGGTTGGGGLGGGGLAGQLGALSPSQQAAMLLGLRGQTQQFGQNPFLPQLEGGGVGQTPLLNQLYGQSLNLGQQQGSLLGNAAVGATQLGPSLHTAGLLGNIGGLLGQPLGPSPLTQGFLNQVGGLPGQLTRQGTLEALSHQALGLTQGNLPALNPQLRAQIHQAFRGPEQDINRFLDQALQGSLERARQQGFAGGTEVFRQGTPSALFAPGLAEATRQQGILGGQEAQANLALAQALPQQGGALATTAGNLAGQNLAAQRGNIELGLMGAQNLFGQGLAGRQDLQSLLGLGLTGAQGFFGQGLAANQNLQQAAQGFSTPLSVALGGGVNLSNLGQSALGNLSGMGQQGIQNQLALVNALLGISGQGLQQQFQGAGQRGTQSQPFNLLSAFAPTASLLGGLGGLFGGVGNQNQRGLFG